MFWSVDALPLALHICSVTQAASRRGNARICFLHAGKGGGMGVGMGMGIGFGRCVLSCPFPGKGLMGKVQICNGEGSLDPTALSPIVLAKSPRLLQLYLSCCRSAYLWSVDSHRGFRHIIALHRTAPHCTAQHRTEPHIMARTVPTAHHIQKERRRHSDQIPIGHNQWLEIPNCPVI